jgi:hypothetical protein
MVLYKLKNFLFFTEWFSSIIVHGQFKWTHVLAVLDYRFCRRYIGSFPCNVTKEWGKKVKFIDGY